MAQLLLSPIGILVQQLSNAGQPLSGGQVFIYVAGTTTPVTTYTDSTGTTPNSNPIVLNSAGRLPNVSVWVPSNTHHKLILEDSNGVTLSTIDQLYGINDPFLINQVSTALPTGGGTANAQTVTNSTPITTQVNGTEQWYTPGVANTGATNINVDSLGNMAAHYLTKALVGGELQPGVPVILKSDGTFWNLAWSAKGPAADTYLDTGLTNSLVVPLNAVQIPSGSPNPLANGLRIKVIPQHTNTNLPSIQVGAGGNIDIYYSDGTTNLAAGALILGIVYDLIYSTAAASGSGGWVCNNPSHVTGSFTGTPTGLTAGTIVPASMGYTIGLDGKSVSIEIPQFTGTSNATTKTITGMPAALAPTTGQNFNTFVRDGGTIAQGSVNIAAAAVIITFGNGVGFGPGGFTASGTAAFPAIIGTGVQTINYQISP